jgi:hypothetical protein
VVDALERPKSRQRAVPIVADGRLATNTPFPSIAMAFFSDSQARTFARAGGGAAAASKNQRPHRKVDNGGFQRRGREGIAAIAG